MKKYVLTIYCVLAIIAIVSAEGEDELTRVKRGGCFCRQERGTYCGSTKRSGAISGDCSEHDLYYCNNGYGLAEWQGRCSVSCYAGTGGGDYCA